MKTLNDYMEIIEDKEDGFVVSYPDLPHGNSREHFKFCIN